METSLKENLEAALSNREAFMKSVSVKSIHTIISETLADLEALTDSLQPLVDTMTNGMKAYLDNSATYSGGQDEVNFRPKEALQRLGNKKTAVAYYLQMVVELQGKASSMEQDKPFSALLLTIERFIDILKELDASVDAYFGGAEVNVFNSRLSHVLILAIINEAYTLNRYATYATSSIMAEATSEEDVVKYRLDYISEKTHIVSRIISRTTASAEVDVKQVIAHMKSKGLDINLVDKLGNVSESIDVTAGADPAVKGFIDMLNPISIFRWLGEKFELLKNEWHNRRVRKVEWMKARVNLLKMKMDGISKDDPEYIKLQGIIEKYEDMIASDDRKIKQYEMQ